MVPVRVFRKMSKYLKVSSSDKDKKASLSSVFCFFTVYVACPQMRVMEQRSGVNWFFYFCDFFLFMCGLPRFLISLIIAQVFGVGKMTRTDV
mgnify:CR=1 FL=1